MCKSSLVRFRKQAYILQGGLCYYCELPMWLENPLAFAREHQLTLRQVRHLKCTGEHLIAKQDGGRESKENIVAACMRCNLLRHRRKNPPSASAYKLLVQKKVSQGHWHVVEIRAINGVK